MFGATLLGFTFDLIWAFIFLVFWIAIAFWPARVAARKGYSFLLFFLFSIFFFFIALIMAYMMPNKLKPTAAPTPTADE